MEEKSNNNNLKKKNIKANYFFNNNNNHYLLLTYNLSPLCLYAIDQCPMLQYAWKACTALLFYAYPTLPISLLSLTD